jgi:hypothetical protein
LSLCLQGALRSFHPCEFNLGAQDVRLHPGAARVPSSGGGNQLPRKLPLLVEHGAHESPLPEHEERALRVQYDIQDGLIGKRICTCSVCQRGTTPVSADSRQWKALFHRNAPVVAAPVLGFIHHAERVVIDGWRDHRILQGTDYCRPLPECFRACTCCRYFRSMGLRLTSDCGK